MTYVSAPVALTPYRKDATPFPAAQASGMPAITPAAITSAASRSTSAASSGGGGTDSQTDRELVATNGHETGQRGQQADERDGESRHPKPGLAPFLAESIRANAPRRQE